MDLSPVWKGLGYHCERKAQVECSVFQKNTGGNLLLEAAMVCLLVLIGEE